MAINYVKLMVDGTSVSTTEIPTWGEVSATGDYFIDGLWYDKLGVEYVTQFTYMSENGKLTGIESTSGDIVDIHHNVLAPTLVEDTIQAKNLVVTGSFDLGQSLVDVTTDRAAGVPYINDTGKPILITVGFQASAAVSWSAALIVGGVSSPVVGDNTGVTRGVISEIVQDGETYQTTGASYIIQAVNGWTELR